MAPTTTTTAAAARSRTPTIASTGFLRIMGNVNRKATKAEMAHLQEVVATAFPGCVAVVGGHGDYGGHRAPRDHTISFRIRDAEGKFCSNVVWILPDSILGLTAKNVVGVVRASNGRR